MPKKLINLKGMHCKSCEILVEENLREIKGVNKVKANHKDGTVCVYSNAEVTDEKIEEAVRAAGYSVGTESISLVSKNPKDYKELALASISLFILYLLLKNTSLFNTSLTTSSDLANLPVVFLIGLTAGVSTCMALVGGIVFAISTKYAEENPNLSTSEKFVPHLFFNLGRVVLFALFGAIIGYLGSLLHFSNSFMSMLVIVVSTVTLLLGLQITGLFPVLEKIKLTLPKGIYGVFKLKDQNGYNHVMTMLMGGLTFFLPCGFTQAMQLYAVSTGNPIAGALTMGVFALGTTPGLLGIGGLSSLVKKGSSKIFFKFAGLVVIALAVFNISHALNLAGIVIKLPAKAETVESKSSDPNVTMVNNVQIVKMTQKSNGYVPNSFTIKNGVPVKWIITSETNASCASSISSNQLNLRTQLHIGENTIEFTPSKEGIIRFSCAMGMYTGSFNVIK